MIKMNTPYIVLAFVTLAIVLHSCSSKARMKSTNDRFEVIYKITKGRSQTKPAFSLEIEGQDVRYNGIANMSVTGEKSYKLDQEKFTHLAAAFKSSNFQNFKAEYIGRMRDLPIATLSYNGHSVRYQKREAPEALLILDKLIKDIAPKA